MELMRLGGPMMWPLLILSIAALGLIVERFLVISPYRVPKGITVLSTESDVMTSLKNSDHLALFREVLATKKDEISIGIAGQSVVAVMEKRLGLLSVIAKTATLMGLLGTILGMIDAFSVIAATTTGVDMTKLAEGLWQALITTATGLFIAIPTYLFVAYFEARVREMANFLTLAGNIVLQQPQVNQNA